MANLTVGISDAKVSSNPGEVLVTHALGSCIGVSVYDPAKRIGGLLHFQLPQSRSYEKAAPGNPFKYADTGFDLMFEKLQSMGACKSRMEIKLAGGAQKIAAGMDSFNIGKRNYAAIRQLLWKKGLFIKGQEVGGTIPRTVYLNMADGTLTIKSQGKIISEI